MKERRRFYRIDDSVILNYQPFPESQLAETTARLRMLGSQNRLLQSSLGSLELRLDFLLDEIAEPLPEIAEALKIINRKLSILSSLDGGGNGTALGSASDADAARKHDVNLSGSGLAFTSPSQFLEGETMEIEFVLLPDYYNIKAIGRVVACRGSLEPHDEQEQIFEVAVDFLYLKEEDREYIIAHILKKQAVELKDKREQRAVEEQLQSTYA